MTLVGMRTSPAICIYTPWPIISLSCLLLNCPCMMSQNNPIIACTLHDNAQHSLFKVQKTLEGFLEHYSGEFIDISCTSSLLASIKSSRASCYEIPFFRKSPSLSDCLWQVQSRRSCRSDCQNSDKVIELTEIMTKDLRWVAMGAILRPGWRWRRRRALPIIRFSLVNIEQIIKVNILLDIERTIIIKASYL